MNATIIVCFAVLTLIACIVTLYNLPYYNSRNRAHECEAEIAKTNMLCHYIDICIRAAEELYPEHESGSQKKLYVLSMMELKCHELGIEYDNVSMDALVTGEFQSMKNYMNR